MTTVACSAPACCWSGPGPGTALLVVAVNVLATAVLAAASRGLRRVEPTDLITEVPS